MECEVTEEKATGLCSVHTGNEIRAQILELSDSTHVRPCRRATGNSGPLGVAQGLRLRH